MRIAGYEANKYVGEVTNKQPAETDKQRVRGIDSGSHRSADIVELSQPSKYLQIAEKAVQKACDIRAGEVAAIKRQISENTYKVDYDKVAKKIVGSMVDKLV